MKKLIPLLTLCLLYGGILRAQEIKPSEQSQGLGNFQNTSVDHSTGIFSYQLPLFELTSGDYKLPVLLSYTAAGVKVKNKPGPYGHGWNLLCGGVITRTLRGGIPDEKYYAGLAYLPITSVTEDVTINVNKHHRDGESDIFTAVFNGQRLHFILEGVEEQHKVRAVPLEKTNVKIEDNTMGEIMSWKLTDENGVIYIFAETERTQDIAIQEAVASNSVINTSGYISAWYLTEIITPFAPSIKLRYSDQDLTPYGNYIHPDSPFYTEYIDGINSLYNYHSPLLEHKYDLEPHRNELNHLIWLAESYGRQLNIELQLQGALNNIGNFHQWWLMSMSNSFHSYTAQQIELVDKCLGILSDFRRIQGPSQGAIDALNGMYNYFSQLSGTGQSLASCLNGIKDILIQTAIATSNVNYKLSASAKQYRIYPKFLTGITCGDNELDIRYEKFGNDKIVKEIRLLNSLRGACSLAEIEQHSGLLRKVTLRGTEDSLIRSQAFTYFEGNPGSGKDLWGYYNGTTAKSGIEFDAVLYPYIATPNVMGTQLYNELPFFEEDDMLCDKDYSKTYSLKNIRTSEGAEIQLDYEPNKLCWYSFHPDHYYNFDYGGIRTKSLVIRDGNGGRDSIHYHYTDDQGNSTGQLVTTRLRTGEMLTYNGGDIIFMEGVYDDGIAIVNNGNNGLLYSYVKEERIGSGTTAYYFYIPDYSRHLSGFPPDYPYWLNGLPIGSVAYDAEGRIVKMQKNNFYANLSPFISGVYPTSCITTAGVPFPFIQYKQQIKSYGFYLDHEELEDRYRNQPDIPLIQDGNTFYAIRPYQDIFLLNLAPRTSSGYPDQAYTLYFGGRVVLKNTKEYLFDCSLETMPEGPRYNHLFQALPGTGYLSNEMEFHYSPNHCDPVKISQLKSNGDRIERFIRKVADIRSGATAEITGMKEQNIVNAVVREQLYSIRRDTTRIISDNITGYGSDSLGDKSIYFPQRTHQLLLPYPQIATLPVTDSCNYTLPQNPSGYLVTDFTYGKYGKFWRQEETITPGERKSVIYDKGNGKPVVGVKNVARAEIDALDRQRVNNLTDTENRMSWVSGRNFVYFENKANLDSMLHDFFERNTYLRSLAGNDPFFSGSVATALMNFATDILYYNSFHPYAATVLVDNKDSIRIHYEQWFDSHSMFQWEQKERYLQLLDHVIEYAVYLNENRVEKFSYKADNDLSGKNLSGTLNVTVNNPKIYYLYFTVNGTLGSSYTLTGSITYLDGSSRNFTETATLSGSGWQAGKIRIDLNKYPAPANIRSLRIQFSEYSLAVLVPEGAEFEAVSRDKKGMLFCKLNHLRQMERYEYDGLGRIAKVYDQDGNLLLENHYNE